MSCKEVFPPLSRLVIDWILLEFHLSEKWLTRIESLGIINHQLNEFSPSLKVNQKQEYYI